MSEYYNSWNKDDYQASSEPEISAENELNEEFEITIEDEVNNEHPFNECNTETQIEKKHFKKTKFPKAKKTFLKVGLLMLCSAVTASVITGSIIMASLPSYIDKKVSVANVTTKINNDPIKTERIVSTDTASQEGVLTIPEIAIKVGPATVGIVSKVPTTTYFGTVQSESSGSGIIISEDGYVVTNQHVINNASEIAIYLSNGEKRTAELVGQDIRTDLAVLKMEKGEYPYAEFGVSSELEVGDLAVAIGNPLGMEFAGSVTSGIISALNRTVEVDGKSYNLIQTDAAINSGNSGGALVNCYGQVIGINSVKVSSAGVEGLGFAIPVDEAKPIISDLINHGYVKGRPVLGIMGTNIGSDISRVYNYPEGVFVDRVIEGSAAEKAGIQRGDIITHINSTRIKSIDELNKIRDTKKAGDSIELTIDRSGKILTIKAVLGEEKNN